MRKRACNAACHTVCARVLSAAGGVIAAIVICTLVGVVGVLVGLKYLVKMDHQHVSGGMWTR